MICGFYMSEFIIRGREIISKIAKEHGSGAVVYVPKNWAGEHVSVVRELDVDVEKLGRSLNREKKIVYSYYVLDIVHRGHLLQMQNAKAAVGNDGISVVGILTEKAVLEKKPKSPVLGFDERMLLAQAIRFNDFVISQDTYSPVSNISFLHPDILMESQSHDEKDIEEAQRIMDAIGGRVITTPYYPLTSSSKIKDAIRRGKNE